ATSSLPSAIPILFVLFFLMILLPPRSTLFPYTTLFRSCSSSRSSDAATVPSVRHTASVDGHDRGAATTRRGRPCRRRADRPPSRSEEHTSELQSLTNLVCRLLLEKKKKPRRRGRHDSQA